jgi:hypothetical protein
MVADGALAVGASNVDRLPGKSHVLEQLAYSLQAGLDHVRGTWLGGSEGSRQRCIDVLKQRPADGRESNPSLDRRRDAIFRKWRPR